MVDWDSVGDWLGTADWGSVPAWLGAGSLILAYEVFRRDRRNADRSQVDLVGAWGEGEYEIRSPGEAEVVEATIKMHLRNASELPVIVKQMAYEVHTRWFVQDRKQPMAYEPVDAAEPYRAFVYDVELAPGETKEVTPFLVNLAHLPRVHANCGGPVA